MAPFPPAPAGPPPPGMEMRKPPMHGNGPQSTTNHPKKMVNKRRNAEASDPVPAPREASWQLLLQHRRQPTTAHETDETPPLPTHSKQHIQREPSKQNAEPETEGTKNIKGDAGHICTPQRKLINASNDQMRVGGRGGAGPGAGHTSGGASKEKI
ncbi:unnamed protein product [Lota lota]